MSLFLKEKAHSLNQDIPVSGVNSVLAKFYRKIIRELGVTHEAITPMLDRMLRNRFGQQPLTLREFTSARGNLMKELMRPTMSWKVFCKGLRLLGVTAFKIELTLTHPKKVATLHFVNVVITEEETNDMLVSHDREETVITRHLSPRKRPIEKPSTRSELQNQAVNELRNHLAVPHAPDLDSPKTLGEHINQQLAAPAKSRIRKGKTE